MYDLRRSFSHFAVKSILESEQRVVLLFLNAKVEGFHEDFNVLIERDVEGYYVASVPELPGCHTQAKSLDSLMNRIKEPIEPREFIGLQRIMIEL